MDAGKVGEKVIVEDGQPAILGQLYVHFDDARAQVVGSRTESTVFSIGNAGFSPVLGPTPWCPIAIGRTLDRRKSSAVLCG